MLVLGVLVFPWLLQALFFMGVSYGGPGRLQALCFVVFCGAEGLQTLSSVVVLTDGPERLFWYCRICLGLVVLMMCLFLCWGIGMWESCL